MALDKVITEAQSMALTDILLYGGALIGLKERGDISFSDLKTSYSMIKKDFMDLYKMDQQQYRKLYCYFRHYK